MVIFSCTLEREPSRKDGPSSISGSLKKSSSRSGETVEALERVLCVMKVIPSSESVILSPCRHGIECRCFG